MSKNQFEFKSRKELDLMDMNEIDNYRSDLVEYAGKKYFPNYDEKLYKSSEEFLYLEELEQYHLLRFKSYYVDLMQRGIENGEFPNVDPELIWALRVKEVELKILK